MRGMNCIRTAVSKIDSGPVFLALLSFQHCERIRHPLQFFKAHLLLTNQTKQLDRQTLLHVFCILMNAQERTEHYSEQGCYFVTYYSYVYIFIKRSRELHANVLSSLSELIGDFIWTNNEKCACRTRAGCIMGQDSAKVEIATEAIAVVI